MDEIGSIISNREQIRTKEPGFLVKTHCKRDKVKFFINVCHSFAISAPTIQLDEKDLHDLIAQENYDELSKFTIPLVLERLDTTKDKKNEMAKMTHVIINSRFYEQKIQLSEIYKNYLVYIVIDTVNAKFNVNLDNTEFVILKNRKFQLADTKHEFSKFIDSFIPPNILNRPQIGSNDLPTRLDETLAIDSNQTSKMELIADDDDDDYEKLMKNLIITLDIAKEIIKIKIKLEHFGIRLKMNDDHVIIFDSMENKILREFYLPIRVKPTEAKASIVSSILTIECPVILL
ncbi:pih1 domain-containing protein 1-like [Dermatophagoides farinae]|uniref:Pih1 domain-containing protein 1-like n=1 Tax=Dermatophagoides farinae TaxID=6954 RepID=A0A9D4NVH6_DERFA|nr:uncharacterized protein LOC124489780 [Dermatophagoides farinae]KAH7639034.1 pih1 domain-containing protein 1-like [Dermatophagoides farinae]